jgi:hypothetical protein
MANNIATQTVTGGSLTDTYGVAKITLPDGTIQNRPVQRAWNDKGDVVWEFVDEKIAAFDARFKGTETIPDNWKPPGTEAITAKPDNKTREDVNRMLLLTLGDPKTIIANKGLTERHINHFQAHPSTLTLVTMLANSHGGEWADAAKFLKPAYPSHNNNP